MLHRRILEGATTPRMLIAASIAALWLSTPLAATIEHSKAGDSAARQLLDQAVQAIGDLDSFDQLQAVRVRGQHLGDGGAVATVDMLTPFAESGDALYMHITMTGDESDYDRRVAGDRSWVKGMGVLPPEFHDEAIRYASTKLLTLLRYRHAPGVDVASEGSETLDDGTVVDLVRIVLQGTASTLEIDRETRRILAVRFASSEVQETVGGQIVRRAYSDHREVEGFTLPHHQVVTVGGEPYSAWTIESFEIDPEVDWSAFDVTTDDPSASRAADR